MSLSGIAGSIAVGGWVELLVSILINHPLGAKAPADTNNYSTQFHEKTSTALGHLPHQIRGFLSHFTSTLINHGVAAYDK